VVKDYGIGNDDSSNKLLRLRQFFVAFLNSDMYHCGLFFNFLDKGGGVPFSLFFPLSFALQLPFIHETIGSIF
jgi:hypothetical protein